MGGPPTPLPRVSPDITAEWWTTKDVAEFLGVTVSTVSAYNGRRQIPQPGMHAGPRNRPAWRPQVIIAWAADRRPGIGGGPLSPRGKALRRMRRRLDEMPDRAGDVMIAVPLDDLRLICDWPAG